MKKMTMTEIKEKAQEELMMAMQVAFERIEDGDYPEDEKDRIKEAASKQMARIEGLFGYEKNSWARSV